MGRHRGEQTGIYPIDSPGGWQLIGRTPIELYNPERQPILFSAGDYIRFVPVSKEEYQEILYRAKTAPLYTSQKEYHHGNTHFRRRPAHNRTGQGPHRLSKVRHACGSAQWMHMR
ncbi:MAG: carboxyltransferase domain-containing protein [Oscillospiraceae bacterium]